MRVGLITMHRVVNCGSQLQTIALYKIVSELGFSCVVIDYEYPALFHYSKRMGTGNWCSLKGIIKRVLFRLGLLKPVQWINMKRFELKQHTKMVKGWQGLRFTKMYNRRSIKRRPPVFDVYLVGSDQVWNPHCMVGDYTYLLDFPPAGKRKVAYSSSFGVKSLPEDEVKRYKELLSKFDAIGTRESSGVDIIEAMGINGAVAVLDPTMLLSRKEWEEYATNRRLHKGRYIFCYILSYVFKSTPWIIHYIKRVAEVLYCDVVFYGGGEQDCIPEAKAAGFHIISNYITPQDMVRYSAFAIVLDKQCTIVTNPNPTNDDRVVSLLNRTGYIPRAIKCGEEDCNLSKEWLVGRSIDRAKFERLQKKSMEFLKCALMGEVYPATYGQARD